MNGLSNKLHLKDIDWIIYFPSTGNEGREVKNYGVAYRDRKNRKSQSGVKINLSDVLVNPLIKNQYPHKIALFRYSSGRGSNWSPYYIEERLINNQKELESWIKQF